MTPELCSICSQLRVVSIVDQTPLGVAVRAQSSELIALLIAYGADVNLGQFCPCSNVVYPISKLSVLECVLSTA